MDFSSLFRHETDTVNFAAGDTILKQGEMSAVMYVLMDGEAEIRLDDRLVCSVGPGALLGELALIEQLPAAQMWWRKRPANWWRSTSTASVFWCNRRRILRWM